MFLFLSLFFISFYLEEEKKRAENEKEKNGKYFLCDFDGFLRSFRLRCDNGLINTPIVSQFCFVFSSQELEPAPGS